MIVSHCERRGDRLRMRARRDLPGASGARAVGARQPFRRARSRSRKLKDTGIVNTPDSLYRDMRVRELLAPQIGAITLDVVKTALFDDFAQPVVGVPPAAAATSATTSAPRWR